jgi:GntR family transcriptional regulator/MocR family aminotransferase
MTEGLDLHLGVDKGAGFVGRALEAALREAIRSGGCTPGRGCPAAAAWPPTWGFPAGRWYRPTRS